MRKLHKGLIIGGATLAVLVPAGLVAADQVDMGNGHGRGNGTMTGDCPYGHDEAGTHMQKRDGTGPYHAVNSANRPGATAIQNRPTNQP
jgi:hypothetical protein